MSDEQSARDEVTAGFAQEGGGARWKFSGPLTSANAGTVFAAAGEMPLPSAGEIDLDGIAAVDSAAVAVLLALQRRGTGEGRPLTFTHVPAALTALANLYGVEEMLVA